MATATKKRSPFQAVESVAILSLHNSTPTTFAGEEKTSYLGREWAEFANAEQTILVTRDYRGYEIHVKTDLAAQDVLTPDADYLSKDDEDEDGFYKRTRERGVFYPLLRGFTSKTSARKAAEALLEQTQDVQRPLAIALPGTFAPALTIALKKVGEREYRQDAERRSALASIATEAGVNIDALTLAVKEDRLTWSTPPVAPKQVTVVVRDEATAALTERFVDEIILATGTVEGVGRIVHEGSIPEYLTHLRAFRQKRSVESILTKREALEEALKAVQNRAASLLADLAKGQVIGRGFHDTLSIAREVETAQAAATSYAAAVEQAHDLPTAFVQDLLKNAYADPDTESRYRWSREDVRRSLLALQALTGIPVDRDDHLY